MKRPILRCAIGIGIVLSLSGCVTASSQPIRSGPPTMTVPTKDKEQAAAELQSQGCEIISQGPVHPASSDWVIQYECPEED